MLRILRFMLNKNNSTIRSKEEIIKAIKIVQDNEDLTYGYKYDVLEVLQWVLGEQPEFDGLNDLMDLTIKDKRNSM